MTDVGVFGWNGPSPRGAREEAESPATCRHDKTDIWNEFVEAYQETVRSEYEMERIAEQAQEKLLDAVKEFAAAVKKLYAAIPNLPDPDRSIVDDWVERTLALVLATLEKEGVAFDVDQVVWYLPRAKEEVSE
jgi:DNA polymerase I-like protein with 3'-5' exonuclease and polymerase domains